MQNKKIDTAGQITAVITEKIKISDLPQIASSIMASNPKVEQVGYLQGRQFRMMGGELSINGLIAGAYLIGSPGSINQLTFTIKENIITLTLPKSLIIRVDKDVIKLRGITYKLVPSLPSDLRVSQSTKICLQNLAKGSEASGLIYYDNSTIKPLIYVPATKSYVWENACGSGSLAYALYTGNRAVIQPSGEKIFFKKLKNIITVTMVVKEI